MRQDDISTLSNYAASFLIDCLGKGLTVKSLGEKNHSNLSKNAPS